MDSPAEGPIRYRRCRMSSDLTELRLRVMTRRAALCRAGIAAGAALSSAISPVLPTFGDQPIAPKVRVAAIFTEFSHRSHAHVILENFLRPYIFCGKLVEPNMQIVSMCGDQFPTTDMAHDVARDFDIPLVPTISEALTLGGKQLACDAVLSIAEHGTYPQNEWGQQMYPRKQFFDQIVQTMEATATFVPLFNDKHLSYRWDWVKEMYDRAQRLGIPFMAGSSVPLAHRNPNLELPSNVEFEDLLVVHGGGPESYDFHALEVMQSLVESRSGGETGIVQVQCLVGDAVWQAAREKAWNPDLVSVALQPELGDEAENWRSMSPNPYLILVYYKDGLIVPLLTVPGNHWCVACRLRGESAARGCQFDVGPWTNRNLFKALAHAIQTMFHTRQPPYPIERTLMTTGITEAVMKSRSSDGAPVPTPHLDIRYHPVDFSAFRENGDSWKIVTNDIPEPMGICPLGNAIIPTRRGP